MLLLRGWEEQNDIWMRRAERWGGWEEQNDIWMRRAERWDEKNYFMWMLCLWSKMLPFTGISLGFHLGLPCFGEETMLFWIMFICLYIYSNLLICYYNMLSDFNKNASHRDRNILKWDLILKFLLRPTQRYNQIWIFFLEYARNVSLY